MGDGPPWNRHPRWRVGGATALSGAAAVGAAVERYNAPDGVADSAPGGCPWAHAKGMAPLWNRHPRWRCGGNRQKGLLKKNPLRFYKSAIFAALFPVL